MTRIVGNRLSIVRRRPRGHHRFNELHTGLRGERWRKVALVRGRVSVGRRRVDIHRVGQGGWSGVRRGAREQSPALPNNKDLTNKRARDQRKTHTKNPCVTVPASTHPPPDPNHQRPPAPRQTGRHVDATTDRQTGRGPSLSLVFSCVHFNRSVASRCGWISMLCSVWTPDYILMSYTMRGNGPIGCARGWDG